MQSKIVEHSFALMEKWLYPSVVAVILIGVIWSLFRRLATGQFHDGMLQRRSSTQSPWMFMISIFFQVFVIMLLIAILISTLAN